MVLAEESYGKMKVNGPVRQNDEVKWKAMERRKTKEEMDRKKEA